MWFGSHFTVGVARQLLLSSRVSLLVINLLTIRERVREKRQEMKLIWGPIHFQGVFKCYEGFVFFFFLQEIHSNNSLRDKCSWPLFLFKTKIFVFKMIRNWLLSFRFLNASTWLDLKLTLRLTSESFLSFSAWFWDFFKFDCIYIQILPCCFRFNWMVIVERYLARHCLVNWSRQLEALIVREQLSSFDFVLPTRSNRSLGECVRYVCWGGRVVAI